MAIEFKPIYDRHENNLDLWVDIYADANSAKTDFFEAKSTAYAKASTLVDNL